MGNAGCPLHPQPRVHFVLVERTRVTTSTPESPGIPARNGFNGLCRALPGDRALLPPSSREYPACPHPVGPTCLPQNLTPASGRQDHTILPSAATSLVSVLFDRSQVFQLALRSHRPQNAAASTASRPYVRDDHDTPLLRGGMRKVVDVIWGRWKQKYFCKGDSTPLSTNRPTGKSPDYRRVLLSCPARGAAPFALLRRAGIHSRASGTLDPGSAAHHAASRASCSRPRCRRAP